MRITGNQAEAINDLADGNEVQVNPASENKLILSRWNDSEIEIFIIEPDGTVILPRRLKLTVCNPVTIGA